MPAKPIPPDVLWFRRAFDRVELSQNEVAARLGMDRSAFSRTLKGKRRLQIEETKRLASVLGVSQEEVLRHAGGTTMRVHDAKGNAGDIAANIGPAPMAGSVDALTGAVRLSHVLPSASVLALAIEGDPYLAGRQLLIGGDITAVASAAKDMGVLQLADGRLLVGKFKPGFTPGRFDIGPVLGLGLRLDDVGLVGLYELVGMALEKV